MRMLCMSTVLMLQGGLRVHSVVLFIACCGEVICHPFVLLGHGDFGPFMDFRDNDNAMNALEKELDRIQKLSGACKSTISNDLDLLTG